MYILKNALRCIGRSKGRNILIGIIVLVIALSACIGLSIRQASQDAKQDTMESLKVTATISVDRQAMMGDMNNDQGQFDKDRFFEQMGNTSTLSLEEYQTYAEASSVESFYYTVTAQANGTDDFQPVSTDDSDQTETDTNSQTQNQGGFGFGGGSFGGGRGMMSQSDFSLIGYSGEAAMTDFVNGTTTVTDGTVFTEGTADYHCLISNELAAFNNLSVKDTVVIANPNQESETYTLTVVGIYTDSASNQEFQAMPGSDPANEIYLSSTALDNILAASEKVATTVTDQTTGRETESTLTGNIAATYVFADTDSYYLFEEQVREMGLDDSFSVSSNDITSFENSLVPLNTLSTMAGWFLLVILIIGAIILIVINMFHIRERKYEIGVLLAMGMKKRKVALQFLTEIFIITMIAVIIGVAVGGVCAVPVTNALLENQITATQQEASQTEQNFGRPGGMTDMPGGNINRQPPSMPDSGEFEGIEKIFGQKAADYVSEINSAMNLTVVWQMLGIAVLLTLIAGGVSILFVMRYEPLKILANRD